MAKSRNETMQKTYLGDAVYVECNDQGQLVLTTEDGISITNTIYLELEVWEQLRRYVDNIHGH